MKKTEKLSILISIVLISLLAISAVSAAEIDDDGSLTIDDKTKDVDTTVVDAPTNDVGTKESEPATVGANPTTDVEKSFTKLNETINKDSSASVKKIELDSNYRYVNGEDDELKDGIVIKSGKYIIDGKNNMIDAAKQARIFTIDTYANVTLQNIIFKGARTSEDGTFTGGAIYTTGILNIINCTFEDNQAGQGGAIYTNYAGRLTIEDSTFRENGAGQGGAIFVSQGTLDVTNSEFIKNGADGAGGAIYTQSKIRITDSNFTENGVNGNGGAIYAESLSDEDNMEYIITNTIFDGNSAAFGGAIYAISKSEFEFMDVDVDDKLTINNATFSYNSAEGYYEDEFEPLGPVSGNGGAIYADSLIITIKDSDFGGNIAGYLDDEADEDVDPEDGMGGAIYAYYSLLEIDTSNFLGNEADYGGAIASERSEVEIDNSEFGLNTANYGGAVYSENSDLGIDASNFTYNIAYNEGGAIAFLDDNKWDEDEDGYLFSVSYSNFTGNIADVGGAIVLNCANGEDNDFAIIDTCIFEENEADLAGGAIFALGTALDIFDSEFTGNVANLTKTDLLALPALPDDAEIPPVDADAILTVSGGAISFINDGFDKYTDLYIYNCTFEENIATTDDGESQGGAISASGLITIEDSEFARNGAENGGAIAVQYGNLIIDNSTFGFNVADYGGAIATQSSNITITDSSFGYNIAENGGAIATQNPTIKVITDEYKFISYADAEKQTKYGNGTVKVIGEETIDGVEYTKVEVLTNDATDPNAEDFVGKTFYIKSATSAVNQLYTMTDDGLIDIPIYVEVNGPITESKVPDTVSVLIDGCDFYANSAYSEEVSANGGAILFEENIAGIITNSTFTLNSAQTDSKTADYVRGGAIRTESPLTIDNCAFEYNSVIGAEDAISTQKVRGGAIQTTVPIKVTNTTFVGNDIINNDDLEGTSIHAKNTNVGKKCVLDDITLLNNKYSLYNVFFNIYEQTPIDVEQIRTTFIVVEILNNTEDDTTLSIAVQSDVPMDYEWLDEEEWELIPYAPVNITFVNKETGKTYKFNDVESIYLFSTDKLPVGNYTVTVKFNGLALPGEDFKYNASNATIDFEVVVNPYEIIGEMGQTEQELLAKIAENEQTIKDLNDQIKADEDKIAELESALVKNETAIKALEKDIEDKKAEIKKLENDNKDLTDKLAAANTENIKLTEDNKNLNTELSSTKDALSKANTENGSQTTTINNLKTENNNLKTENSNLQNQATASKNEANAKIKKVKAPSKIKKSKKLKITVTLNKKVKGKYVYVAFNGKTYKAKTNKKGIAKITIKKSALKKLGGKKIKYQVIYNQSLKNKSIKIKK